MKTLLQLSSFILDKYRPLKLFFKYAWVGEPFIIFRITLVLGLMVFRIISTLSVAFFLKNLVNALQNNNHIFQILLFLFSYGILWIFRQIAASLQAFYMSKMLHQSIRRLNMNFVRKLNDMPAEFHVNKNTGELISSLERARSAIQSILQGTLLNFFPTTIELLLSACIFSKMYSSAYGLVLILGLVICIALSIITAQKVFKDRKEINTLHRDSSKILLDILQNFELIHYFDTHEHETLAYDNILRQKEEAEIKRAKNMETFNIGQNILLGTLLLILNFMMVSEVLKGRGVSDLIFVNSLIMQFFIPLRSFGSFFLNLQRSFIDLDFIFKILSSAPKVKRPLFCAQPKIKEGSITFKNVSFCYPDSPFSIKNCSFEISQGKTIAIVGETGMGKSTISKLIFGFYEANSGEICIDGHNIKNIGHTSLSNAISIVPQNLRLLNSTIYQNIAYGKCDASIEEVMSAAKQARLEEFIMSLPDQYETSVGEGGIKLSGGEKQRLAIARALIKNPLIYIFDEATSFLDLKTKSAIYNIIKDVTKNKTTIIISHCLSSIMHADQILLLKDGMIKEQGSHQELIEKNGLYYELWSEQTLREMNISSIA